MNEAIKSAIAWETGNLDFTADVREGMLRAVERNSAVPPRLMLYNRRRLLVLAAAIACVLMLAGFTAVSLFSKLFETIPYHDVVVNYKSTTEYAGLLASLAPGDVATTVIDEKGVSVLYKYLKGDHIDLECYGENVPDGGFMMSAVFEDEIPESMQLINKTNRTPDYYREQGMFAFALADPAYRLVEAAETRTGLFSLTYQLDDGRHIMVQAVYGRFQDTSGALDYRPEYLTIGGREFMFLETEDAQGITHELFCFLGDDKLTPGIEISGVPKEELLEAAAHLTFYNEKANVPGAVARLPADIYSDNGDPLLRERADEIVEAVTQALKSGSESAAWSAEGREIHADPSEYARYDVQITYTPQAWSAVETAYEIPAPPLTSYGWVEDRPVMRTTLAYQHGQLEAITIRYGDGGNGTSELSIYPLNGYLPQTQLDATLVVFIPAGGQIPDELVQNGGNYAIKARTGYGETLIYTAVLYENGAWGYRYQMQS